MYHCNKYIFNSFGKILRSVKAGPNGISTFSLFEKISILISILVVLVYIPSKNVEVFLFPTSTVHHGQFQQLLSFSLSNTDLMVKDATY